MPALVRLVHPAPTAAVVALSAALGAILGDQAGSLPFARLALTTTAILGSQILTGALNDWVDRERDRRAARAKPIPKGLVSPRTALGVALSGALLQVVASIPLGPLALTIGLAASASALIYNVWLSRTLFSVVPYLVSFGLLPLWIAAGIGVPLERVAVAPLIVGPFAAAAHLANAVRDFETDRRIGSANLAQALGRRPAFYLAWGLANAVGIAVGTGFAATGRVDAGTALLGIIGLAAVAQGILGPERLWRGMLVAAVLWTAGWAIATG